MRGAKDDDTERIGGRLLDNYSPDVPALNFLPLIEKRKENLHLFMSKLFGFSVQGILPKLILTDKLIKQLSKLMEHYLYS